MEPTACARHPAVPTRLRCSACETPICPDCGRESAVGYKCPDCATHEQATTSRRQPRRWSAPAPRGSTGAGAQGRLPTALGARATAVGLAAAVAGGLVLSPVLQGGAFLLLTSGIVGWAVARAVVWAVGDRGSPFVRAVGLTLAGFTVAIALAVAGVQSAPPGLLLLAYPAAVYGGWIAVRGR